jgi:catechol 2,3-dioxygenase-like lactoylglutathione lyase family enzyme
MSTPQSRNSRATHTERTGPVELKLEVVVVPVSDVDRAKRFYLSMGWRLDADFAHGDNWRLVQITPPGSACSLFFGKGVTKATPGSAQGLLLAVDDIEAARVELIGYGVDVSAVFHFEGDLLQFTDTHGRVAGPDPQRRSYLTFASFDDPDGNGWVLQEISARLPGRGLSSMDVATLISLLRETEERHGDYEPTAPKHHWSEWYAAYLVARQRGGTPDDAAEVATLRLEGDRR